MYHDYSQLKSQNDSNLVNACMHYTIIVTLSRQNDSNLVNACMHYTIIVTLSRHRIIMVIANRSAVQERE